MYKKKYIGIRKLVYLLLVFGFFSSCVSPPPEDSGTASSPSPGRESDAERGERQVEQTKGGDGFLEPSTPVGRPGEETTDGAGLPLALPPERIDPAEETIDRIIAAMDLSEMVGQMIIPARIFDSSGGPVQEVDAELVSVIQEVQPGGFILFGQNIVSPEQLRRFVSDIQGLTEIPLLIAVDQEGGLVRRIVPSETMPATPIPAASQVGRSGDPDLAYRLAGVIARELFDLGVNINLAPVADIRTNPDNPVTGSRAFSDDPETVATMVEATIRGLQENGVGAVVKHFPGHGDTTTDSHADLATIPHGIERLRRVEMVPFVRGIETGVDAVLTGHISVPALTGDSTPTTLSYLLTEELLRTHLGFEGVIITDALTMAALTNFYTFEEIIVGAVQAGADLLLRPGDAKGAHRLLQTAVEEGRISEERIEASVRRILRLKLQRRLIATPSPQTELDAAWHPVALGETEDEITFLRYQKPDPSELRLGVPEHQAIVDEVIQRGR